MSETLFDGGAAPGIRDIARDPLPGTSLPGAPGLTLDGKALLFLAALDADSASSERALFRRELDSGATRRLFAAADIDAGEPREESLEEALLKERLRNRNTGITSWRRIGETPWLLLPIGRNLHALHEESGVHRVLTTGESPVLDPKVSPDATRISYARDGELQVLDFDRESGAASGHRALTSGDSGTTRGIADFVAQEEMKRSSGQFWSPDSRHIAFLEVDDRHIPELPIVHEGKDSVVIERHRYPFAGADNPRLRLGVVEVESGAVQWLDPSPIKEALDPDDDGYIARVDWFDGQSLAVQVQDRRQTRLALVEIALETGRRRRIVVDEQPSAWINLHEGFRPLDDGRFLWLSERSGFMHLEIRTREGELDTQLTEGEWLITELVDVTESDGGERAAWVVTTRRSPLERHLERVDLDTGAITTIGPEPGWHTPRLELRHGRWLDRHEDFDRPPRLILRALTPADGASEAADEVLFDAGDDPRCAALARPELIELQNRDGVTLHGAFYRARGVEGPAPLVVHVYGGPHAQRVQRNWRQTIDMRAQVLGERGFHVLRLDNRGSAFRGLAFETPLRHETGRVEVDDQVDGVRFLVERGDVDPKRVGIVGWSYGGYMSLMSLARAPETFRVAVSGAPVTHWDGYDTHYTERYMGLPAENAEGYRESSVMANVEKLEGRILLIHGLIDENVHFRHTARLINALIEADKDYDLLVFPNERHMPRGDHDRAYLERRIVEYFERHL